MESKIFPFSPHQDTLKFRVKFPTKTMAEEELPLLRLVAKSRWKYRIPFWNFHSLSREDRPDFQSIWWQMPLQARPDRVSFGAVTHWPK